MWHWRNYVQCAGRFSGLKKLVVAVSDEPAVRRILGVNWNSDGTPDPAGACYLGRRGEYVCLRRAFDEESRPTGWRELSPYERVVLADGWPAHGPDVPAD